MRFVWAVLAFVLATLLIAGGISQRSIFLGPKEQQVSLEIKQELPYTLVDGDVLRAQSGEQTLIAQGEGKIFAAVARTSDLTAWLSEARYNSVTVDDQGQPVTTVVEADPLAFATPDADAEASTETGSSTTEEQTAPGRNPAGSDLWLDEFTDEDRLVTDLQIPEGMSVLIATNGTAPAPSDVVVSWPITKHTPWAGPMIVAGGVLMAVGLVLYILAIRHARRGRGPLRKAPAPLPTEPITVGIDAEAKGVISAQPEKPRRGRRKLVVAIPALVVVGSLVSGCSADSWPQLSTTPTPTPTETVVAPENQQAPALTEAQATRILAQLGDTVEYADANLDPNVAASRLTGAALAARETNYSVRGVVPEQAALEPMPEGPVEILLPQAFDSWPRTAFLLVRNGEEETSAPVIMSMTQDDPWATYKVGYIAEMQASAESPNLAPAWLGATLTPPDSPFLLMAPGALAESFADVVDAGDASENAGMFDDVALEFAASVAASRKTIVDALAASGAAETSSTTFDLVPGEEAPVGLASLDSGAVVAVSLHDIETIVPTNEDAVIRLGGNEPAKALTEVEESEGGFTTTYGMQLFFSVPSQGSKEPIRLLAVSQDLLSVEVIEPEDADEDAETDTETTEENQ